MSTTLLILIVVTVVTALIFDLINGFHDSANSIATIVSTRVLSPKFAVLWAAFFNFVAMFIFQPRVAETISKIVHINGSDNYYIIVVLAGLIGAIVWNIITWWWGLPSSSSHALMGGLVGAGISYQGINVINWVKVGETALFIPIAPIIGMILGFAIMLTVIWIVRKMTPRKIDSSFRLGQLVSAALYSISHGGNDAQKTMGVIYAVLIAGSIITPDTPLSLTNHSTIWIILACHLAMAIGTMMGGWKIVKTVGTKLTKLKPIHGFSSELAGATSIFFATALGIPISTTHTISGAIIGTGSVQNLSGINWPVAVKIVAAWIITIPAAALMGAISFWGLSLIF